MYKTTVAGCARNHLSESLIAFLESESEACKPESLGVSRRLRLPDLFFNRM